MRSKFAALSVAAVLFVGAQSFLAGCNGAPGWRVEIVSPERLDFVASAHGLATPARLVTLEGFSELWAECTCPYIARVGTGAYETWRYPLEDTFWCCAPEKADPCAVEDVLLMREGSLVVGSTSCGGWEGDPYEEREAELPVHVEIVDPGSDPFPGLTRNGGEDVAYFHLIVPEGTPGLTTQTLEIVNQGGGTLTWTLSSDQPWLSLDPFAGDTAAEQDVVEVNVNVAGLEAGGILFGTITVTSNSPDLPAEEIVVVLQVT